MIEVFRYQTEEGKEPLTEWLQPLRDKQAQAKIRVASNGWRQEILETVIP